MKLEQTATQFDNGNCVVLIFKVKVVPYVETKMF